MTTWAYTHRSVTEENNAHSIRSNIIDLHVEIRMYYNWQRKIKALCTAGAQKHARHTLIFIFLLMTNPTAAEGTQNTKKNHDFKKNNKSNSDA